MYRNDGSTWNCYKYRSNGIYRSDWIYGTTRGSWYNNRYWSNWRYRFNRSNWDDGSTWNRYKYRRYWIYR
jgi:hypothetical protein